MSISPDQLPSRVSNFIAYGPEERAADPTNGGEVITARPQVYVRYFPGIVVSNLTEGGRSGNREGLLTVHFDPASVGFSNAISAHMNNDDHTVSILRNSLENKAPIAVAIETQRKKKNSSSGNPISPLTPIHALRGAEHPNGDGDGQSMLGPSGQNTSNRVAFVNGLGTQHIQSNPSEWKSLVNNKSGDLPPEGWRNHATGEDWKEIGAAIRDGAMAPSNSAQGGAPATAGGFPSPNELASLIQGIVSQSLKDFGPTLANQIAQASGAMSPTPQGRPSGKFEEGKQWNPRTSDGRINLGGYVVSSERWVFEWAYRHLTEDLEAQIGPEDAWRLSEAVLSMASTVQANAYGHGFVSDRTSASHREAEHWVQWVVKRLLPYPGLDADEETFTVWSEEVVSEASALLAEAGRHAGDYFSSVSKRDKNGAAPQAAEADESNNGPSEKVVRAFLDVIQKGWDNPETIKNLGIQGRENGYGNLPVSMVATEDGVEIAFPPAEGQKTGPLESLLIHRYRVLTSQTDAPAQDQAPASDAPAQDTPVQNAPEQETSPAPADTPEQAPVPEAQEPDSAHAIIERLKVVSDDSTLRSIYEDVSDANLLATKVYVAPGPNGEVIFGQEGQDGFQEKTIGSVISIIRASLGVASNATNASNGDAPAAQEHQDAPVSEAPQEEANAPQQDTTPAPVAQEAPEVPQEPQSQPVEEQAPEEVPQSAETPASGAGGEALRIAEAAGKATTPDEVAALRAEAEQGDLLEATVNVNETEGPLNLWLAHQTRRTSRAQRNRK